MTPLVGLIAVMAAGVAASGEMAPTGVRVWDIALTFLLVLIVVGAASRCPRWINLVIASIAAALGGLSGWGIFGWAGLAVAVGAVGLRRRSRIVNAVVAGLVFQSILRLDPIGFFGLPSLIAAGLVSLVLVLGFGYSSRRERRRIRIAALIAVVGVFGVGAWGAISMLDARANVDVGVASARRALDAARSGDPAQASGELARARSLLESAHDSVRQPGARMLQAIPIVAQHYRAIEAATRVGADVASQLALMVSDLETIEASFSEGEIDLAALGALAPRLANTSRAMSDANSTLAQADSRWLVPALKEVIGEFTNEIDDQLPDVELAAEATALLPNMLGAEQEQHYLVFFGTPAEAREFGGFVGSWALVGANDGKIDLIDSGRKFDLYEISRDSEIDPATTTDLYMEMARPITFPENLTSSPDFEFVADMTRQVLGGITDRPLAGLIYLDAIALIDMLELTGPVEVDFRDEPITTANAAEFFLRDQYEYVGGSRNELFGDLGDVAERVLDSFASQELPGPERLGEVLGPSARGGHLQIITFDQRQNDMLRSVRLLRDFGPRTGEDFIAVAHSNGLPNKMDLYLERSLDHRVDIGEDGTIRSKATVTLTSTPPQDAPPYALGGGDESGTNRVILSIYSLHALVEARIDGQPVQTASARESGLLRHLVQVDLTPEDPSKVVEVDLQGWTQGDDYSLRIWQQPLILVDSVSVAVNGSQGFEPWQGALVEPIVVGAEGVRPATDP